MKKVFPLDREIYETEKILTSIEDFSETCNIRFLSERDLEIEAENDEEIDMIFGEFMNYVISL